MILGLIGLFLSGFYVHAADVQFHATVDRTEAALDDVVRLKIQITAEADSLSIRGPDFEAPQFEIVNQFSGSYQNGTITSKGFQWTTRREFTFFLKPKTSGALSIRNIRAEVEGRLLKSKDLVVSVGGSGTSQPQRPSPVPSLPMTPSRPQKEDTPEEEPGDARYEIFVRPELSVEHLYKGQMATLSYYLYSRVRVIESLISKFPNLNGFFRDEMELPSQRGTSDVTLKVIGGETYEKRLIARYSIYALRDGKLEVDPISVKVQYQRGKRADDDGFSDPFLNFFRQLTPSVSEFSSDVLKLDVLPLPTEGKPKNFSGAVGEFQVMSAVDRYEVEVDQPVKLTITIEGNGNVNAFQDPHIDLPRGVELFDSSSKRSQIGTETSQRVMVLEFLPRRPGTFHIPELSWSYFSPKEKKYLTQKVEGFDIQVKDGLGEERKQPLELPEPSETQSFSQDEVTLPPLVTKDKASFSSEPLYSFFQRAQSFLPALLLGLVLFVLFGWDPLRQKIRHRVRKRERRTDPSRKVLAQLQQEFALAARHPHREEVERLWRRLDAGVQELISAKLRHAVGAYSQEELGDQLMHEGGLTAVQWDTLSKVLDRLGKARYSGIPPHEDEWFETWLEVQKIFR